MLSSPQTLTPKPAALPPAMPTPLPGSGNTGNGPSFAQFLNTQPEVLTPPAHTDPVPRESDSAPEAAAAPAANAPARRPQTSSSQAKPATPAQKSTADAPPASAKDAAACEDSDATTDATATADAAQDDPETAGLTEFTQLIGLTPPAQPATPVAAEAVAAAAGEAAAKGMHAAHAGNASSTEDSSDASEARITPADESVTAKQQSAERRATEAPVRADAAQSRAKAADAAADKVAAQGAGSSTDKLQALPAAAADSPRAAATQSAAAPNFAAMLAQALPTATAAATDVSATPAQGQVHAAVHSNAFGAELGARVSLLAVDGQQSAELQLNPGDMGPVAVQIVVDGSQAQVSFHAAHAETRAALEKSLPDLAAALQGQGLTLSGGGVFQQAPRDSGEASDREESTGRSARADGTGRIGATGTSTVAAPIRRTVGLLDTFA